MEAMLNRAARRTTAVRTLGRYLLTLLLVAFVETSARAEIRFYEPVADAGTIQTGSKLSHEFRFINTGPGPVAITEVRRSCGCLKPQVEMRTYYPGEEGVLQLDVNTLSQSSGPHHWKIGVLYQSGRKLYEAGVQLGAEIASEVSVQPAALTVFADGAVQHEVTLMDQRSAPLTITDVRTSSPQLIPQVAEEYRDEAGRQIRKVRLEVASDYPEGRHDEVLDIYTNDPHYPELQVPVTIIKKGQRQLTTMPSQIAVAVEAKRALPSQIVLLRDPENRPVRVDEVRSDSDALSCTWASGPGTMATLRVRIDSAKVSEPVQTSIQVRVSQPFAETLSIPVTLTTK